MIKSLQGITSKAKHTTKSVRVRWGVGMGGGLRVGLKRELPCLNRFMAHTLMMTVFQRDQLNPFRACDICQSVTARDMGLMCAHQHVVCVCVCVLILFVLAVSTSPLKTETAEKQKQQK